MSSVFASGRPGRRLLAAVVLAASATVCALPAVAAETVDLAGSWRYRVGDDDAWRAPRLDAGGWRTHQLPAAVADLLPADETTLWLRRPVTLDELDCARLGWKIGTPPRGRYDLYADGRHVGTVDTRRIGPRRLRKPRVFPLPPEIRPGSEVLLAVRYARLSGSSTGRISRLGPLGIDSALGCTSDLEEEAEQVWLRILYDHRASLVLAWVFLVLGAYHLQLFARRRNYREYLWFGVAACLFALMTYLASPWVFDLTERYAVVRRLSSTLVHVLAAAWIQFMWPFLGQKLTRPIRLYQLSQLVFAAIVLLTPAADLLYVDFLRWLWLLPALILVTVLLAQEAWRGNVEARVIGIGGLALVTAVLAEIVSQVGFGITTTMLPFWAFALFALSMTVSLSNRFTRVHLELDQMRLQLERMVADRTDELTTANQRLKNEIAERQLAEGAMRVLERAVEQSSDGIAVTDMEGNTRFVNEAWARMHGYEVLEVLRNHFSVFFTPQQWHRKVVPFVRKAEESRTQEGEIEHRHRDGSTFPTWMSVTLLRDGDGAPDGFVAIARDISRRRVAAAERLRLESRVQRAQRLESLAQLAGRIAHDYNNLLTAVLSNAGLVRRELEPDSPVADKIGRIETVAERARDLTKQLLTYAGEDELRPEPLSLNHLVQAMEEPLRPLIGERASLDLQLAPDLPLVELDPDQIRQMIHHLASNAVESLGTERGFITLRTSEMNADPTYFEDAFIDGDPKPGPYVFLEVSDSGMGMDAETRQRMFEPLFTTKAAASGLGLAVVEGIVRRHGGTIKVFSEPGGGTTVQVLFPSAHDRPVATVEETAQQTAAREEWRGSGTILVVDDQDYVREVARAILESFGFEVLVAVDGQEALALYRRHRSVIRLVLLDWTMPGMGGEQVFREIRRTAPKARVIVMSGWQERQVMHDLADLGLSFLAKPFKPEEVIDKVREILS